MRGIVFLIVAVLLWGVLISKAPAVASIVGCFAVGHVIGRIAAWLNGWWT